MDQGYQILAKLDIRLLSLLDTSRLIKFWYFLWNFSALLDDKWSPQERQFGDNISNEDGDFVAKTLMSLALAQMAIIMMAQGMRMMNMIRGVIKSDHPGRNCCRRSVVTTGGAVA